jgi:uncharacterized membrane protein (UPF0127 family)
MPEPELTRSLQRMIAVRTAPGGAELARRVRLCRGFGGKFLGLMFRPQLAGDEGALLVYTQASRSMTSIHMFFVAFPLGVFWLDSQGKVVDRARALPWRPYYASSVPAWYVLELPVAALDSLRTGDRVEFYETDSRA